MIGTVGKFVCENFGRDKAAQVSSFVFLRIYQLFNRFCVVLVLVVKFH